MYSRFMCSRMEDRDFFPEEMFKMIISIYNLNLSYQKYKYLITANQRKVTLKMSGSYFSHFKQNN